VRDRNHPSIVTWTPLNEAWHPDNVQYPRLVKDVYTLTHTIDPTRPVNTVSGGVITDDYDICAMHNYEQDGQKLKEKVYNPETGAFFQHRRNFKLTKKDNGFVASKANFQQPLYDGKRPYILDEFGGIKCLEANPTKDMSAKGWLGTTSWGYGKSTQTKEEFYTRLAQQIDALLSISDKVWGYCYTQLTDVEQEENGLYYYDRKPKYDATHLKAIFGKEPK
jgi:beta-galactosidase/beta-glucuronidase